MDKVRGRTPQYWFEPEMSISQLECVDRTYSKVSYDSESPRSSRPSGSVLIVLVSSPLHTIHTLFDAGWSASANLVYVHTYGALSLLVLSL